MSDASLCVFGVTAIACDLLDGRLETVLRLDDMLRGPHGMGLAIVKHGGKVFAAELGSDHVVTIRSPLGDTWPDVGAWTAIDRGRWSPDGRIVDRWSKRCGGSTCLGDEALRALEVALRRALGWSGARHDG